MSGLFYSSASDRINRHPYRILVPRNYQPNIPEAFLTGEAQPFFKTEYPEEPQVANYQIKYMIDMADKRIQFTILNDEDVLDIFDVIDSYLESVVEDVEAGDPVIIAYVRKVLYFRENLYGMFFRILNTPGNYELKRRYYKNNRDNTNFFSLQRKMFQSSQFQEDQNNGIDTTDPIYLKRYAPKGIDRIIAQMDEQSAAPALKKAQRDDRDIMSDEDDTDIVDRYMR